jgi:quercetin dioxygenase-like cupin family protein
MEPGGPAGFIETEAPARPPGQEGYKIMKIVHYREEAQQHFDGEQVRGVTGRVVIGQADGASHFCMRVFELATDGYTPRHAHPWEHEIFIHAGHGQILRSGEWVPLDAGCVVIIPGGEEHQIRNDGHAPLVFACLIPAGAPEL